MSLDFDSVARAAASQIWQITVLLLLVAGIVKWLCRRRPHLAYVLWTLVILKCLTPPVWSSPTGVFSWLQHGIDSESAAVATSPPVAAPAQPPGADAVTPPAQPSQANFGWADAEAGGESESRAFGAVQILLSLWLAGAIVSAALSWYLVLRSYVSLRRSRCEIDPALETLLGQVKQQLGVRRRVHLLVTSNPFGPAVFGLVSPTIVLPERLVAKRTTASVRVILAHEVVHIRRGDTWLGIVQLLAQVVWWFHPLVWWANRRMTAERERLCDEETIAGLNLDRGSYAQGLIDALKLRRQIRPLLVAPGVGALNLTKQRLEHIMNLPETMRRRMPRAYWLVLAVGAVVLLPGGAPASNAEERQPPAELQEAAGPNNPDANKAKDQPPAGSGVISRLPEDGTQAIFDMEGTVERDGRTSPPTKGELAVSSVGRGTVDGAPCRWIEFAIGMQRRDPERSKPAITKLFLAEDRLISGADPLGHIVKGWSQGGAQDEPRAVGPNISPDEGPLYALLPGKMQGVEKLPKKTIKTPLGELECDGVTGHIDFKERDNDVTIIFKIYRHEKAPFGVAAYEMQIDTKKDGNLARRGHMNFTLREVKHNVKSELPKGVVD